MLKTILVASIISFGSMSGAYATGKGGDGGDGGDNGGDGGLAPAAAAAIGSQGADGGVGDCANRKCDAVLGQTGNRKPANSLFGNLDHLF